MKRLFVIVCLVLAWQEVYCWGFFAHQRINYLAVFLLPPQMLGFYKKNIVFITQHAVDPDKRRYAVAAEGPRHFIDIDHYGLLPFADLPHNHDSAVLKFSADTLNRYGIVPWWIPVMQQRLTKAFIDGNAPRIMKLSAELGHYIADAHVPLHASSNHNGQKTGQDGIHGFWESRIPELMANTEWDFFIGQASYITNVQAYTWKRVLESAAAADTVLREEKQLQQTFPSSQQYAFEDRNGHTIKQYSRNYALAYEARLKGMIERRMRQSVFMVASCWYTAWVNAGQPDLSRLSAGIDSVSTARLDSIWRAGSILGRSCD